jgi:hypothetical protein
MLLRGYDCGGNVAIRVLLYSEARNVPSLFFLG